MESTSRQQARPLGQFIHAKAQGYVAAAPRRFSRGGAGGVKFRLGVDVDGMKRHFKIQARASDAKTQALLDKIAKGSRLWLGGALHQSSGGRFIGVRSGIRLADAEDQFAVAEAQGVYERLREEYGGFAWADLRCKSAGVSALLNARLRALISRVNRGDTIRLSGSLTIFDGVEIDADKILFESVIKNMKGR